jgi:hypothetical protein
MGQHAAESDDSLDEPDLTDAADGVFSFAEPSAGDASTDADATGSAISTGRQSIENEFDTALARIVADAERSQLPDPDSEQDELADVNQIDVNDTVSGIPPPTGGTKTPQDVIDKLSGLTKEIFPNVHWLTHQVQERSYHSPDEWLGLFGFPMFCAGETGAARGTQKYVCRRHDCPAHITYETEVDQKVRIYEQHWEHNHDVDEVTLQSFDELTPTQRAQIDDLTSMNMTAGQIRIHMGLAVSAEVLYDARRRQLRKFWQDQAEKLLQEVQNWDDMKVEFKSDEQERMRAVYFFHKVFKGKEICRQVLILDDTSCTNRFGLPLLVILGVDEHDLCQLIGFAFLRDRTTEQFAEFLVWFRDFLGPSNPTKPPVPLAFLSDRGGGQLAGLEQVFIRSIIVWCAKHLLGNISRALPPKSKVRAAFWPMIDGKVAEDEFLALIEPEMKTYKEGTTPWNMLRTLRDNTQHYLPSKCREWTTLRVTSCVEGFFGVLKNMLGHSICTLVMVAKTVRLIGRMWLAKHVRANRARARALPFLPSEVMSEGHQRLIGRGAVDQLRSEFALFESLDPWESNPDPSLPAILSRKCCDTAQYSKLPCAHLMHVRAQQQRNPLLDITDVDARYHRAQLTKPAPEPVRISPVGSSRRPAPGGRYSYANLQGSFEGVFKAAGDGFEPAQRLIEDWLGSWDRTLDEIGPPPRRGSRLHEPPVVPSKGQASVHPSWRAGILPPGEIHRGPNGQFQRPVTPGRHCGKCGQPGHYAPTCKENPQPDHM